MKNYQARKLREFSFAISTVQLSPVLCAAIGTVTGFYGLGFMYGSGHTGIRVLVALGLAPLAALCLFRVLASVPPLCAGEDRLHRFLMAERYTVAFSLGLALGFGAAPAAANRTGFGISSDMVRGLSGVLLEDPRLVSGGRAMAALSLREAAGSRGLRASARGELPVFFPAESVARLREFGRGSVIFTEGKLRQGRGASPYLFSAESLHVVQPAPVLERFRTGLRLGLVQRFDRASSGSDTSWGALALALLLGIRDSLDSGLAALYRDAGCSYILALSGMHLAILASLIALFLKKPLGLKAAALTGGIIIILYCFIVGPLPSLTRAALMYLLGVVAVLGFFKRNTLSLLGMAFIVQILIRPASGLSLSFILSYLALAGILTVGKSLNSIFRGKMPSVFLQPLSASLGAFLATAGVSAWFFGVLRPVGILAGLALVPLTTVFMIGSVVWLGLDIVSPAFSLIASRPLSLLYLLMEKTVSLAAKAPGLSLNPHAAIWGSIALSIGIVYFALCRQAIKNRLDSFVV